MNRSKELMDMYISEGMMVEDLIELIVSLENDVKELNSRLDEINNSKQISKNRLIFGAKSHDNIEGDA